MFGVFINSILCISIMQKNYTLLCNHQNKRKNYKIFGWNSHDDNKSYDEPGLTKSLVQNSKLLNIKKRYSRQNYYR